MRSSKIFEETGYLETSPQNMISPNGFMRRFAWVRIIGRAIRIISICLRVKHRLIQAPFILLMPRDFIMVYSRKTQEGLEKPISISCFQEPKLLATSDLT